MSMGHAESSCLPAWFSMLTPATPAAVAAPTAAAPHRRQQLQLQVAPAAPAHAGGRLMHCSARSRRHGQIHKHPVTLRFLTCSQNAHTARAAAKILTKVAAVLCHHRSCRRRGEGSAACLPGTGGAWLCTSTAPVHRMVRMVHRFNAPNPRCRCSGPAITAWDFAPEQPHPA